MFFIGEEKIWYFWLKRKYCFYEDFYINCKCKEIKNIPLLTKKHENIK